MLKRAFVPCPSKKAAVALPAKVDTVLVVKSIFLTRLAPLSTTYIFPFLSTADLYGLLKVATESAPLTELFAPVPAILVTIPSFEILFIACAVLSVTIKSPVVGS
ncbi:hypothetical protein D3C87_1614700 [compost metagenome]